MVICECQRWTLFFANLESCLSTAQSLLRVILPGTPLLKAKAMLFLPCETERANSKLVPGLTTPTF
jgi:hypothetical protein